MLRRFQFFLPAIVFAVLPTQANRAQDKPQEPKIVLDLQKPVSGDNPSGFAKQFGATCKSPKPENSKDATAYHPGWDKRRPVAEWMGAPIEIVKIHRYSPAWKNPEDVRKRVATLLKTQSGEVYPYEAWDEMGFEDIVATVQFSDHTEAALEISSVHVCFTTHSGTALWLRILPGK